MIVSLYQLHKLNGELVIYRTVFESKHFSVFVANFGLKIQGWFRIKIKL